MRLSLLAIPVVLASIACSTSPGAPSLPDAHRKFECEGKPPETATGGSSFEEIYESLLSPRGVAKCQDAGCHGGTGERPGGLALGSDRKGAYCGLFCSYNITPSDLAAAQKECACRGEEDAGPGGAGDASTDAGGSTASADALLFVITPRGSGPARMPNATCNSFGTNRKLEPAEIDRIKAWAGRGAPNDSKK